MEYSKPVIVAQNNANGSYAAGCPEKDSCQGGGSGGALTKCQVCERTK
jgi:hypothetical protein